MNKTNITNITNITLYPHQLKCIEAIELNKEPKCLINQWCGTGKTRTFTIKTFMDNVNLTVFVFPSLGLINQYNNDYVLNRDPIFNENFNNYKILSFCSENDKVLNNNSLDNNTHNDNNNNENNNNNNNNNNHNHNLNLNHNHNNNNDHNHNINHKLFKKA